MQWCRNARDGHTTERVGRDGLPARIVLQPVDVDAARPGLAPHLRNLAGPFGREPLGDRARERLRVERLCERRVYVQAERPDVLGSGVKPSSASKDAVRARPDRS